MFALAVVVTHATFQPFSRAAWIVSTTPGRAVTGLPATMSWNSFDFVSWTAAASTLSLRCFA
jgi:hypothetical protein